MNLVKWSPYRELEDIQTRLNRFFNETPLADWSPAVDIQETDAEYLIKAELPELKKDDVKIEMLDGVLSIRGERREEKEEKGKTFHRTERSFGKFVREFALPAEVDPAKIEAQFKDGILNIHLPKTTTAKAKPIEVKVA